MCEPTCDIYAAAGARWIAASRALSVLLAAAPLIGGVCAIAWSFWSQHAGEHHATPASFGGVEEIFGFVAGIVLIVMAVPYAIIAGGVWRGRRWAAVGGGGRRWAAVAMIVLC